MFKTLANCPPPPPKKIALRVERCKSLVKNFDRTLARANAKLKLCFIRLMLKRLATI